MLSSSSSKNSTIVRSEMAIRITRAALHTAYLLSEDLGAGFAERLFTSPRRHARPDREKAILATGRPFTVDVQLRSPRWNNARTKVAAWRWGFGPTVLLVHGWEGRGSQLGSFVEPLVAAGLSVVAFDAPGHGDSPGHRLYLTDLADAVIDVAAATGPIHATISHSFGSAAVLLAFPRGGFDAARNIMIAPNVIIDDAVTRFTRAVAIPDSDRAVFERHLAAHSGLGLDALDLEHLVAKRDAGLLVVHDPLDREVPFSHGERLANLWPQSRILAPESLGHRRILRDEAVIAETVAFAAHGVRVPVSDLVREVDRHFSTRP
jgi:hypothetical protein